MQGLAGRKRHMNTNQETAEEDRAEQALTMASQYQPVKTNNLVAYQNVEIINQQDFKLVL